MDQILGGALPTGIIGIIVFSVIIIWSLVWKGWALWRAARLSQKWWFIIFIVINTLGILEIIYLFVITRGYSVTVEEEISPESQKK